MDTGFTRITHLYSGKNPGTNSVLAFETTDWPFALSILSCDWTTVRSTNGLSTWLPPRVIQNFSFHFLRLDLQSHPPNSGIVGVSLQAIPAPPRLIQYSLLEPPLPNPEKVSHTLGRLTALLGKSNIGSPALRDTHRPDAIERAPFAAPEARAEKRRKKKEKRAAEITQLSLRRFRPPRPTRIRSHQVVTCAGPWRSSGDWWTGTNQEWARDEWDVELLDGSICRIYWDHCKKNWFLEGIYD